MGKQSIAPLLAMVFLMTVQGSTARNIAPFNLVGGDLDGIEGSSKAVAKAVASVDGIESSASASASASAAVTKEGGDSSGTAVAVAKSATDGKTGEDCADGSGKSVEQKKGSLIDKIGQHDNEGNIETGIISGVENKTSELGGLSGAGDIVKTVVDTALAVEKAKLAIAGGVAKEAIGTATGVLGSTGDLGSGVGGLVGGKIDAVKGIAGAKGNLAGDALGAKDCDGAKTELGGASGLGGIVKIPLELASGVKDKVSDIPGTALKLAEGASDIGGF